MATPPSPAVTFYADQEHDGLRTAVVFQLFLIIPLSYWFIYGLISNMPNSGLADYAVALSCMGGLVLGLALSWGIEQLLKRVWHSGQAITVTPQQLHVTRQHEPAFVLTPTDGLNQLAWYFALDAVQKSGRERRLPKKWLCLAYQLLQGENRLVVYTYMPPKEAQRWLDGGLTAVSFHELEMAELLEAPAKGAFRLPKSTEFPAHLLTGKNGRYWVAERHRGKIGLELTRHDFAAFIQQVTLTQKNSVFIVE